MNKNQLTLFEKIFATTSIINAVLALIGAVMLTFDVKQQIVLWFISPIFIQLLLGIIIILKVEIIFNMIWGIDVHAFPSLFGKEESNEGK